jgi:4-diphosphocytidyl-2-C-methyl-D-erythritol kinase
MICYPKSKINLGLHVVSKRPDGYHNIETVFHSIDWTDIIEIVRGPQHTRGVEVHSSGLPVAGKHSDNLCVKAYNQLAQDYSIDAVKIYLHKQVPMGAGLGGGSADAAAVLKALNELFGLKISTTELEQRAAKLGADCAFFIQGKPVFAESTGTQFSPCKVDLSGYHLYVVHPGIHVGTAEAYSGVIPAKPAESILEILSLPVETWKDHLHNDFEKSVFARHAEIAAVKRTLYDNGAVYASMSGSGSAVFGIFRQPPPVIVFPANYKTKITQF